MGLSKENENSANKKGETLNIKTFSTSVQQPGQAETSYCEERKGGLLVFFIIIIFFFFLIIFFFIIIITIIVIIITNTRTKFITFIAI